MKFNFDCVFYYVSDIERAVSFYAETLGLKVVSRDVVARFEIDGVLFELVPAPNEAKLQGGGNARLCLQVNDIHQAVKDLQTKGISTSQVQDKGKGMLASFEDPDGNEVYLWQEKSSVAQ
jgi:catechol 2,3-dioxygenase-like lactoylglutathione lyase family enzyme